VQLKAQLFNIAEIMLQTMTRLRASHDSRSGAHPATTLHGRKMTQRLHGSVPGPFRDEELVSW
jgi:hypothetical protein